MLEKNNKLAFKKEIVKTIKGLLFVSESESKIEFFDGGKSENSVESTRLSFIKEEPKLLVREIDFETFFSQLIKNEDWFGKQERKMTEKFIHLKAILKEYLCDLRVYKVGKINIEIYVVGKDNENNFLGIKMKAVET